MTSTLYYSERCSYCKQLMKLMSEHSLSYKLANIDFLMDYPREVTRVPTLITKDDGTGKSNILIGKAIFESIQKKKSECGNVSNSVNYSDGNSSILHVDVPQFKSSGENDFVYLHEDNEKSLHPVGSTYKYIQQSNDSVQNLSVPQTQTQNKRSASQLDKQLEELQRTRG